MYDFEATRETSAKPENVWSIYANVPGWLRWHGGLEAISFPDAFASGSRGHATVQLQLSMTKEIPFAIENLEPMKQFDVVWTVGPLLYTRMTYAIEPIASGTRIRHAYHTGGVMAPFNFLQADVAKGRVQATMDRIAELAEASASA